MGNDQLQIETSLITDTAKLLDFQKNIESFLASQPNPFLTFRFLLNTIEFYKSKREVPAIIVYRFQNEIIGVAPILLRRELFFRIATSLPGYAYSPDFLFVSKFRDTLSELTIDTLFDKLKCKLLLLYFPYESPTNRSIQAIAKKHNLLLRQTTNEYQCHNVIEVNKSWEEFEKIRGSGLRRKFRVFERKLNNYGEWTINFTKFDDNNRQDIANKIYEIEKMSWKEVWRKQRGIIDNKLSWILESAASSNEDQQLIVRVCFLNLNHRNIAYCLYLQFRERAYIAKTSFAEIYRRLYPGIFLNNEVVKDLFLNRTVKQIDWMTNLDFNRNWPSNRHIRVRYLISQGMIAYGILTIIKFKRLFIKQNSGKILKKVYRPLS
ncbi:MAG: GNAT family N-acetyltransferase [Candidatus Bathyarchaeia archaeon]|jgi:hypothetical protein